MTTTAEVLRQARWTLLVVVKDGRALAVEHLKALAGPELRKVTAFLERTAIVGPLGYPDTRSRKLSEHIFELKPTAQVRLPYFFDGRRRIVMTHAFTKKRQKAPREEIDRAERLRAEYLGAK